MHDSNRGLRLALTLVVASPATLAIAQSAAPPVAGRTDGAAATPTTGQPGAAGSQPISGGGQAAPPSPFGGSFLFIILGVFVLMIVMQSMSGRKAKKQRAEMLSSLKRHDRVQTIGGLIGSVAEVRDDEVVLKIDEATNTKVRVVRSAIQSVLRGSASPAEPAALESSRS